MDRALSTVRTNCLRFFFLFNAVVLGFGSWPHLVKPDQPWDLMHTVAYSIYAGYSLLMLAGVWLPARMLPLLLLQILYKSIWLIGVGWPMWASGHPEQVALTLKFFALVVVMDVLFIPWPYVWRSYVRGMPRGEKIAAETESRTSGEPLR